MSVQQCEACEFLQMDQQEAYCVRCRLRAVEKVAAAVVAWNDASDALALPVAEIDTLAAVLKGAS